MATYYDNQNNNNTYNNNTEIQGGSSDDGLQTLLLMNPITPYHDHLNLNNNHLVFLNPTQQQQHLVGIPLDGISALHHSFMPCQQGPLSLTLSASPNKDNFGVTRKDVVLGSRYLKAAQELLDEVVSVGREIVRDKIVREESTVTGEKGSGGERGEEMSAADRQEIQIRKAKLIGMLDEVEQRYRQYHHQMQIVISWFEQATGMGSAKTYTALALETISKQSRCLKDAITSQIRASSKSLGEEDDSFSGGKNEGSRLKFVDNHIRQQRALQQLGMTQPNAWKPQRGLPESSVSVLRAWLFEHFLHPYPKDTDKIMLAKQTGLTRSQVSNWFINARVRLWKPMVEEMYIEEIKDQEQNDTKEDSASKTKTLQEKTQATRNENMNLNSVRDTPTPVISASTLIRSLDMESFAQASPKKQRNMDLLQSNNCYLPNEQNPMTFGDERQTNFIGGFGAYPIGEVGKFGSEQYPSTYSANGVSLTLGLPHREHLSLSNSFLRNQNIEMGRGLEIDEPDEFETINNTSNSSHSSVAYESLNIQNRKRFAAQLLPDFVT